MLYVLRKNVKSALLFCAEKINFPFLTPNRLTLLSIPAAAIAAYYIFHGNLSFALVFVFLAFFIDALDGALAEVRQQKTPFGNYLDAVVDRIVEATIFFGFAFLYPVASILAFSLGAFASYSKAFLATLIETDNRDWQSLGGRADRAVLLVAGMSAAIFVPFFNYFPTMELVLYFIAAIVFIGNIQRIIAAKAMISEFEKAGK